jgi:molybdate transport system ATP-binding protein
MSVLQFDCRFRYASGFQLDFAFDVDQGVTALIGPSGCGKSTILQLIAGLLCPDSGRIVLRDRMLFSSRDGVHLAPERRAVGYVFQDYQLFPHLNVEHNLRYGQRRSSSDHFSFAKTVEILELEHLLQRRPATLSGGEKQRVAIGRAVLRDSKLLLLDEPFNALDAERRASVSEYLSKVIVAFQIPTLLVSHDTDSVNRIAHQTVRINAKTGAQ